jgi:hypothetical protein
VTNQEKNANVLRVVEFINVMAGLGLIVSTFAIHHYGFGSRLVCTDVSLGILIAAFAAFRGAGFYNASWVSFMVMFLGAITLARPFITIYRSPGAFVTAHVVVGAVVIVCSLISIISTQIFLKPKAFWITEKVHPMGEH